MNENLVERLPLNDRLILELAAMGATLYHIRSCDQYGIYHHKWFVMEQSRYLSLTRFELRAILDLDAYLTSREALIAFVSGKTIPMRCSK